MSIRSSKARLALALLLLLVLPPSPSGAEPTTVAPFGLTLTAGAGGATITVTGTIATDQPEPGRLRILLTPESLVTIHPDATGDLPPLALAHGKPPKSVPLPAAERSLQSVQPFTIEPTGTSAYLVTFPPRRPPVPVPVRDGPTPPRPPSGPATVKIQAGSGLVLSLPRTASWVPAVSISMDPLPRTYRVTLPAGTSVAFPMGSLALADVRRPALLAWLRRVAPEIAAVPGTTAPSTDR